MKVLVPLNNTKYLHQYIEAGADEFYIGFYDKKWEERFGDFHDINRMSGFKEMANTFDFQQLLEAIEEFKRLGKELYITFNSSIYSQDQLDYVGEYFKRLKEVRVDGVIVSTIELVQLAKKHGIYSVISTIAGIYNSDLVDYYKRAGANRIILPRDLSIEEIRTIVLKNPEIAYEVFMMRNGCGFSDSNCLGLHRKEICSICSGLKKSRNIYRMSKNDSDSRHRMDQNNQIFRNQFHNYACGLCSIYDFVSCGISACKIVGRYDEWKNVCKDISLVKQNIIIAKEVSSREEYKERMIFPEKKSDMCKQGLSCYYPEVRF